MSKPASDNRLALFGGKPFVTDAPAYRWPVVPEQDAAELKRMALASELSYYGREGHVRDLEDKFGSYLGGLRALATTREPQRCTRRSSGLASSQATRYLPPPTRSSLPSCRSS